MYKRQVVCYLLGYGCCAVPGALFIKKYTYKSGVMLGLGLYAVGALLFYPAMLSSGVNVDFSFFMYLLAIFVLFAGLSVLETSTNSVSYTHLDVYKRQHAFVLLRLPSSKHTPQRCDSPCPRWL